ncbi:(2Fe-2S) ferredoxin domain-containing protein [bacterium]|nr:MAG: (2Fe-2S) ferredoxin domain-containing protein [bacterium]
MPTELQKITRKAEKRGIPSITHHVFFCGSSSCCKNKDEAKAAAKKLGKAAKQSRDEEGGFEFTPVECLNLCTQGPLAVVYPEGVWYAHVDEEAAEKIIEQHLKGGQVVEELVFARSGANPTTGKD